MNQYWNSGAFFPASCETCIGEDGNLTDYHKYQLAEDPNVRVGFLSTKQDAVVTVERGTLSGPEFERQLLEAIDEPTVFRWITGLPWITNVEQSGGTVEYVFIGMSMKSFSVGRPCLSVNWERTP